jgi:hypothetical protein
LRCVVRHRRGDARPLALVQVGAPSSGPFASTALDLVLADHGGMSWADPCYNAPEVAEGLCPGGPLAFGNDSPFFDVRGRQNRQRPSAAHLLAVGGMARYGRGRPRTRADWPSEARGVTDVGRHHITVAVVSVTTSGLVT